MPWTDRLRFKTVDFLPVISDFVPVLDMWVRACVCVYIYKIQLLKIHWISFYKRIKKHEAHRKWRNVTWKCVLKQQMLNATEQALPCSHSQGTICTCPHSSDISHMWIVAAV